MDVTSNVLRISVGFLSSTTSSFYLQDEVAFVWDVSSPSVTPLISVNLESCFGSGYMCQTDSTYRTLGLKVVTEMKLISYYAGVTPGIHYSM